MTTQSQTVKPGEPDPSLAFFTDDKPKLKSVFDNVRNYAICATIFAVAAWFKRGTYYEMNPGASRNYFVEMFISYAFLSLGIALTLLNAVQTYVISAPAFSHLFDWFHALEKAAEGKHKTLFGLAAEAVKGIGLFFGLVILIMIIALLRVSYFSISHK